MGGRPVAPASTVVDPPELHGDVAAGGRARERADTPPRMAFAGTVGLPELREHDAVLVAVDELDHVIVVSVGSVGHVAGQLSGDAVSRHCLPGELGITGAAFLHRAPLGALLCPAGVPDGRAVRTVAGPAGTAILEVTVLQAEVNASGLPAHREGNADRLGVVGGRRIRDRDRGAEDAGGKIGRGVANGDGVGLTGA